MLFAHHLSKVNMSKPNNYKQQQNNANGVLALDFYVFTADKSPDKFELKLTPK